MRVNKAERQNLRRVAAGGALDRMAGEGSFHRDPPPRRALGGGPRGGDSGRSPAIAFPTPSSALARGKKKIRTALLSSAKSEKYIKIDVVQERVTRKDLFIDFLKWKSFKA